jgi:hypothetical protein
MKANEISKGIQIEKEVQSLFGSSRQGGDPNQVRVHLGLQEQCSKMDAQSAYELHF